MRPESSDALGPCTLEGRFVRLDPLRMEHAEKIREVAPRVDWSQIRYPLISQEAIEKRILLGIEKEKLDEEYAFAVFLKNSGQLVGSTSYLSVTTRARRVEIGATWYVPEYQGTFVNPESKFLLLRHAFEDWHAGRIQLITASQNIRSQRAIERLGAKYEGELRDYGMGLDGQRKNARIYSITSPEWPLVKAGLIKRLESYPETVLTQSG